MLMFSGALAFCADIHLAQTVVGNFAGKKFRIRDVAGQLSVDHIPVGMESVDGPQGPETEFTKEATVADVLDSAVRGDPRYRWEESDGVINILPAKSANPIFDVKIRHFGVEATMEIRIVQLLLETPEVQRYLRMHRFEAVTEVMGPVPLHHPLGSLAIADKTLRQALNASLLHARSFYWFTFYEQFGTQKRLAFTAW
jgi:hypothetical protein